MAVRQEGDPRDDLDAERAFDHGSLHQATADHHLAQEEAGPPRARRRGLDRRRVDRSRANEDLAKTRDRCGETRLGGYTADEMDRVGAALGLGEEQRPRHRLREQHAEELCERPRAEDT